VEQRENKKGIVLSIADFVAKQTKFDDDILDSKTEEISTTTRLHYGELVPHRRYMLIVSTTAPRTPVIFRRLTEQPNTAVVFHIENGREIVVPINLLRNHPDPPLPYPFRVVRTG